MDDYNLAICPERTSNSNRTFEHNNENYNNLFNKLKIRQQSIRSIRISIRTPDQIYKYTKYMLRC